MPQPPRTLYWFLGLGLVAISSSPILVRFGTEVPALTLATWRTIFACLLLLPFALPRMREARTQLSKADWGRMGAAGVLLGVHFYLFFESLYHITVASATVLISLTPIFLAVLGYIFLRERLSGYIWVAVGLSIVAAMLIGWGAEGDASAVASNPALGNSLALVSCLLVSIYLLIGRVARRELSWLTYVFPVYTFSALTLLVLALITQTPLLGQTPLIYLLCLGMAVGPQLIGHGSFNYALKYLPAALLGLLSLTEPIFASLIAFGLFQEVPSGMSTTGMLVAVGAVVLALWPAIRAMRGRKKLSVEV